MGDIAFGLNITVIGMGLVFTLLGLLWLILTLIGKIDSLPRLKGITASGTLENEPYSPTVTDSKPNDLDPEVLTAITIAVMTHTARKRSRKASSMQHEAESDSTIAASRWLSAGRTRQTNVWAPKG